MNIEKFIAKVCLLGHVTYDMPFDKSILVFRVGGKIFLLTNIDLWDINKPQINIKAHPEDVQKYLSEYDFVLPAYHMNKKHWITLNCESFDEVKFPFQWILDSYKLVYNALPKKIKTELEQKL
jgi:predicted DNA-binding protein (MmcQ/YjbR family)